MVYLYWAKHIIGVFQNIVRVYFGKIKIYRWKHCKTSIFKSFASCRIKISIATKEALLPTPAEQWTKIGLDLFDPRISRNL